MVRYFTLKALRLERLFHTPPVVLSPLPYWWCLMLLLFLLRWERLTSPPDLMVLSFLLSSMEFSASIFYILYVSAFFSQFQAQVFYIDSKIIFIFFKYYLLHHASFIVLHLRQVSPSYKYSGRQLLTAAIKYWFDYLSLFHNRRAEDYYWKYMRRAFSLGQHSISHFVSDLRMIYVFVKLIMLFILG